ncbi:MAG TPA: Ig-like domain-containing protein [Capsulimonadaceae bacterium]|nr:Ig-like domain-containing protein [Capsulimonadaceae bacterium]
MALILLVLAFFALPCLAAVPNEVPPTFPPYQSVEAWRIRIDNAPEGPIQLSIDQGTTWHLIGRVITPATRTLQGYLAAGYAPVSTVAATAVHGIRIRIGDTSTAYPNLLNIVPKEFAVTPNYYGGHIAGVSGIYTDIPSGVSLFRELAPYAGSKVYLENGSGGLAPLTAFYSPAMNDLLVIVVRRPLNLLRQVIFENKTGGDVTATYADGKSQVITHVAKPVLGVGRFDGTSYTGVGAVNTNHMCVITVSTAPISTSTLLEGTGPERRGGFQIEPAYHNSQTEEAGAPQILVVGPPHAHEPSIEGTPPLFFGYIDLAYAPGDLAHSWICDVQYAGSPDWKPMPKLIGEQPYALQKRHVTAFRLRREKGVDDTAWLAMRMTNDSGDYAAARRVVAKAGKEPVARGMMDVDAQATDPGTSYVQLYIDGQFEGLTNTKPFSVDWDTRDVADGEHLVEARAVSSTGSILSTIRSLVWVDNSRKLE